MIPKEIEDSIHSTANIVEVISDYVSLKKKGANYIGFCPFHDEKTASMIVSPAKGIFKCFGCGAGGNASSFIMQYELASYPKALEMLAKKYNIEIPKLERTPEERAKDDRRGNILVALKFAADYYHSNLSTPEAVQYLKERGISKEIAEKYQLGYALNEWNAFFNFAKRNQFDTEVLIGAGLIYKSQNGYIDKFRSRLMFPFFNLNGNVTGFTGRIVGDHKDAPKYLNTDETEVFHKGKNIYGLYQARQEITKSGVVHLVEGNIDVLSLVQAGYGNTICGSGTAFTPDQVKMLRRFTDSTIQIYDGDPAGVKATFKNMDLLLAGGMSVTAVMLPDKEDPDSFVRKNDKETIAKTFNEGSDFIILKWNTLKSENTFEEGEAIREIISSISLIPDEITRDAYIRKAHKTFGIPKKLVTQTLSKISIKVPEADNCLIGFDEDSKAAAIDKGFLFLTKDLDSLVEMRSIENENSISFSGELQISHIQEIRAIVESIHYPHLIECIVDLETKQEVPKVILLKRFVQMGLEVKVLTDAEKNPYYSFIDWYKSEIEKLNVEYFNDNEWRTLLLERGCELLSYCDNSTQLVYTDQYAKALSIKASEFKKAIKPFIEKKKSRSMFQNERLTTNSGSNLIFDDPNNLPAYVDKDFFHKWGYFAAEDEKANKLFYVFRTDNGGLTNIGNFYLYPLFHVYDKDPNYNKRVFKLFHSELYVSTYIEMRSVDMVDFALFKKTLALNGGYWFTKGKNFHYDIIYASICTQFPRCAELKTLGWQDEGFYAFANAIYIDGKIEYMNDLGLVKADKELFYSPAFSKIYVGDRKENDKYRNDRTFIYRENSDTSFERWAKLMVDVYSMENNGHWAVIYAMMSTFRSIIHPIDRLFTSLFFVGPTESGKTQIAVSVRSLFETPEAPSFNLNSGTDAAFFTILEKRRDAVTLMEEYNDYQISPAKFQGLKAAVYDGEGKQKRKDATSKDLDIPPVNCALVLLGQLAPEQDDGSLGNRCVIKHVKKKDDRTDEEIALFQELKKRERNGLTNILIQILSKRPLVEKHYKEILRKTAKELKLKMDTDGLVFQTRMLNIVSLFAAMVKFWETYAPEMKFPFTYADFETIAINQITSQSEQLSQGNQLSVFFDTIALLMNKVNGLMMGRELKVDSLMSITVLKNGKKTEEIHFKKSTKVLFLRLNLIQPLYKSIHGNESLKPAALNMYLKDHPAHIGIVKSTRFEWNETQDMAEGNGDMRKKVIRQTINTSCVALDYEVLTSILGFELERFQESTAFPNEGEAPSLESLAETGQLSITLPD